MSGPGWSDIASWYDGVVRSGRTPHGLAVRTTLDLAGDVTGRSVLDVACGQGIASRALARAGAARVVGVDLTEALLDAARAEERADPLGITYLHGDAQRLDGIPDASADSSPASSPSWTFRTSTRPCTRWRASSRRVACSPP
jgi:ubiquinone/menaquinone biosynthesis C-methylase UbiE